ncbi:MAG: lipid-A-disaccharide synthase, partial [Amoebophilaceae bacterium]|nr:lipid-A-disaccharide synthase [Amoebophilaceae bacterium]
MQNKGSYHPIKIKPANLMRYYIITGEHSGDIHGADLIAHLKQADPKADFWSCGGAAMAQAMGKLPNIDTSTMGYIGLDFLKSIYTLWQRLRCCKQALIEYHPAVVILIDYSGFNMRLADFAKKRGYIVYYYIPPKIWAHHPKRIKQIKKNIDKVLSILPFEVAYYQNNGYHTIDYVGNPLVQKVATHRANATFLTDNGLPDKPIIALLPGSRLDEIERILPHIMVQGNELEAYQLVVAGLSHIPSQVYQKLLLPHVKI